MNKKSKQGVVAALLGILSLAVCTAASAAPDLVVNGGFEAGFAGWAATTDFVLTGQQTHSGTLAAASGCFSHACVDTAGSGSYITQTVATAAGTTYELSFWAGQDSPPPGEFSVFWNGNLITDQYLSDAGGTMVQWTFGNLLATGASTVFELHARQDSGSMYFDDVSVVASGTGGTGGGEPGTDGPTGNDVPEPASLALLGLGLASCAAARRRAGQRQS